MNPNTMSTPSVADDDDDADDDDVVPQTQTFHVTVAAQDGNQWYFKVKPSTVVGRLTRYISEIVDVDRGKLLFVFDGTELLDHNPIHMYGLDELDVIDVCVRGTGGIVGKETVVEPTES
eukprot:TRINITY_DN49207_c0_g1_i1.p1 TRINITY_DN49207_c0_g1~~TRINITY_DN49207_c0_g1_i1.p1  ORF type:complete len:119 (-),score=34.43 TRINITY_DN49207_c0_g1_i1:129-485(-)